MKYPTPEQIKSHAENHTVDICDGEPVGYWLVRFDNERKCRQEVAVMLLGEYGHWTYSFGYCGISDILWCVPLAKDGHPLPDME